MNQTLKSPLGYWQAWFTPCNVFVRNMAMRLSRLKKLLPRSAKARLALVSMVASTFLTCGVGFLSYYLTQQQLTEQRDDFKVFMQRRLERSIALEVWNFNPKEISVLLESELSSTVLGLAVYNKRGEMLVRRGNPQTEDSIQTASNMEIFTLNLLPIEGEVMGRIDVTWSDARFKQALNQTLWLTLLQLVGMNLVLLGISWVGADRLIFRRVRHLQKVLDHAASREVASDIVALQVTEIDEFGAITQSINTITHRLGYELEAGQASEEEARAALSNLQNAQEGLVRAEKMAALGSLVAGVSHELNTPIGNILMVASTQQEMMESFAQSVAAGTLKRSHLETYLKQAQEGTTLLLRSAHRAADLIQNFKQVAVDQTSDRLRTFDLAHQILEVLSVIAHITSKTFITLVQELEPDISMHTYPGPLGQVLTNLVLNAITHAFEPGQAGQLTIMCKRLGDMAHITVTDNGIGISAQNLGKIFDPFFTTKLGQGGSGLGLHICHNIVFGPLGGKMTVKSILGQGTVFSLLLPCRVAHAS